jgi:hypothetical protein
MGVVDTVVGGQQRCCGFGWCPARAVGLVLLLSLGRLKQAACGLWNFLWLLMLVLACFKACLAAPCCL